MDIEEAKKYWIAEEVEKGIWVLTCQVKTVSRESTRALNFCLDHVENTTPEDEPCAIITTTNHPRIYNAGLDFSNFEQHKEEATSFLQEISRSSARFLGLGIPTIAAINGECYAAGCAMSMGHDFRIMRPDRGKWCVSELDYGLHIVNGMTKVLSQKLDAQTYVKAYYAHKFTPQECLKHKIVDKLSESSETLMKEAIDFARTIYKKGASRKAYAAIKRVMYEDAIEANYYKSAYGYNWNIEKPKL